MISKPLNNSAITISVKVYQALLVAYPTKFQQEYGSEMVEVFRDCCLRALRQGGTNGMVRLWALTLLDFLHSVVEQHLQKETHMSKSQLIRFSGWAFILGGFAFIISLPTDSLAWSVISSILLATGLLGLRARYGEKAGGFGKSILLIGVIGAVVLYMVLASMAIMYYSGVQSVTLLHAVENGLWILIFGGPAVLLLALTLFGLAALRSKPMARLNWLPVFAGIWYPVWYFFMAGYLFTNNGEYPAQYQTGFYMLFLIQFIALCVFGAFLGTDSSQDLATA
jgi:hypothetical protein